ncbi:MAG: glucosaminidase domain-containing protein [Proteobacteria bacterium]|nr:glucosaminidase domain-containing protein [Pseudomonadota bacterium]
MGGLTAGALKTRLGPVFLPGRFAAAPAPPVSLEPVARPHPRPLAGLGQLSTIAVGTASTLKAAFALLGYAWEEVREGEAPVPRFYLAALPPGFAGMRDVEARKRLFLEAVLPLVLRVNEAILVERRRLLAVRETLRRGLPLGRADRAWLDELIALYDAEEMGIDELLKRVDAIPPSLALAQASKESGWGISRFAREGNALFGQRTWGPQGMIPLRREPDKHHRVRAFDTLIESVLAYAHNLNTNPAYAEFRALRARMQRIGEPLDPTRLVGTLARYSEQRAEYVRSLSAILRANRLAAIDRAALGRHGLLEPVAVAASFDDDGEVLAVPRHPFFGM